MSAVATREPTGIMTIMLDHWRSDGSAEPVIFGIMPQSLAHGEVASRFRYCAKASRAERGEGNNHPTVKPLALMRWLVRLVTPPGCTVLDPFAGSGSTGVAALEEGMQFVGIELGDEYARIAKDRLADAVAKTGSGQPPSTKTTSRKLF